MADRIDDAIGAAAAPPTMVEIAVQIASTGRPFAITLPLDLSPTELLEVIGWMAVPIGLPAKLAEMRGQATGPRLIVPRRILDQ